MPFLLPSSLYVCVRAFIINHIFCFGLFSSIFDSQLCEVTRLIVNKDVLLLFQESLVTNNSSSVHFSIFYCLFQWFSLIWFVLTSFCAIFPFFLAELFFLKPPAFYFQPFVGRTIFQQHLRCYYHLSFSAIYKRLSVILYLSISVSKLMKHIFQAWLLVLLLLHELCIFLTPFLYINMKTSCFYKSY